MTHTAVRRTHPNSARTWDDHGDTYRTGEHHHADRQPIPTYRWVARICGLAALLGAAAYTTLVCIDASPLTPGWQVPPAVNGLLRALISLVAAVWLSEIMIRRVVGDEAQWHLGETQALMEGVRLEVAALRKEMTAQLEAFREEAAEAVAQAKYAGYAQGWKDNAAGKAAAGPVPIGSRRAPQ